MDDEAEDDADAGSVYPNNRVSIVIIMMELTVLMMMKMKIRMRTRTTTTTMMILDFSNKKRSLQQKTNFKRDWREKSRICEQREKERSKGERK